MSWTSKRRRARPSGTRDTIHETFRPTAASTIATVAIQPPSRSETGRTKRPIALGPESSSMKSAIRGGVGRFVSEGGLLMPHVAPHHGPEMTMMDAV